MPRQISIEDIEPGMVLAEPVKTPNGGILLGAGSQLSAAYINKLRIMDIIEVTVEGEDVNDIDALMSKIESATTSSDEITQKITEKLERTFYDVSNDQIMKTIMILAKKILIEREQKRLGGEE